MNDSVRKRYKDLFLKQQELMREYLEVTNQFEEDEIPFPMFPSIEKRVIIHERRCPLENKGDFVEMLAVRGAQREAIKEIRDFTKNAKALIIVDPYIFSGKAADADSIAAEFEKSARMTSSDLKKIHIIHDGESVTKKIRDSIKKRIELNKIQLTIKETDEIHDRVWIADRGKGLVVGTSLNGLGNKAAFLLPLPNEDLQNFLIFLDQKGLSRSES